MSDTLSPITVVQCPNPACRKFMMVEEDDRSKPVQCLLCRTPIKSNESPPTSTKAR